MRKFNIYICLTMFLLISFPAFPKNKVEIYFSNGQKQFSKENYEEALKNFETAKKKCKTHKCINSLLYVKISRRLGDCYYYLGNYTKAMSYYQNALKILENLISKQEKKDLLIHKAHLFTMMGNVYLAINCKKAIPYYQKALTIYKKLNYKTGIGGSYLNIGNCYTILKNLEKAKYFTEESLKYFTKKDYYSKAIAYSNLADIYILKKKYDKALKLLKTANKQCKLGNRKRQLIFNYIKLGKLEKDTGHCPEALKNFANALSLAKKLKDKEAIRKTLLLMADCHAKSGNYKDAYLTAMTFIKNTKELFSKQLLSQLAEMEKQTKTRQMEKEITKLENISLKQKKSLFLHRMVLSVLIIFAIGFVFSLFQRQKLIEDIEKKNEELKHLVKTIEKVSQTDDLTGLPNRRGLTEFMDREISRAKRQNENFCFAICDLDNFKTVNDKYSHQVGDIVLMAVAKMFQDLTRKIDIVARFGGEEFVFVFSNTDIKNAKKVCEKIRKTIEETEFPILDNQIKITLTFGITEFKPNKNFDDLYAEADTALYAGKEQGKNKVICYNQNLEK